MRLTVGNKPNDVKSETNEGQSKEGKGGGEGEEQLIAPVARRRREIVPALPLTATIHPGIPFGVMLR